MSFMKLLKPQRLPQVVRQLEQDVDTVINVLWPGPVGIVEHKFTAAEINEATATVRRAVENWLRNCALERNVGRIAFRYTALGQLSESSDVYSFGVFLLELVTGREAACLIPRESKESLAHWVEVHFSSNDLLTQDWMAVSSERMKELVGLTFQCLNPSARSRPKLRMVASEFDRILETEMTMTTIMGDGTATDTLGSQLFTS